MLACGAAQMVCACERVCERVRESARVCACMCKVTESRVTGEESSARWIVLFVVDWIG